MCLGSMEFVHIFCADMVTDCGICSFADNCLEWRHGLSHWVSTYAKCSSVSIKKPKTWIKRGFYGPKQCHCPLQRRMALETLGDLNTRILYNVTLLMAPIENVTFGYVHNC
jgi:hypothetical protein